MVKRIFAAAVALLLLCALSITAAATHPVPDLSVNGSITFQMNWNDELLDSGSLNVSKVGEIAENNGDYSFALPEGFDSQNLELDFAADQVLAQELLTLAKELELEKISAPVEEGKAVFSDLTPGLYVVWQEKEDACEGFAPISPFLISMPKFQDGAYVVDVVAVPKVGLETVPPTTAPPAEEEVPQTGQLNWPVPVLAISGAVLFIFGFVLWTGRKRAGYER